MPAPIVVEQLTRSYGKRRGIIDVTFRADHGEILGFLGPNGAGKTTTIRLLMGMLRPAGGSALVFGIDCWADSAAAKASIGFLPGDARFHEGWTGHEFLDFFAAFRSGSNRLTRDRLVERFELDLATRIKHLSKGNRQKLGIVQAFMHDAPLLILDEPSGGLDPLMQAELLDLMREERDRGKTIFLSTHNLTEVERVADRVGIIREGRLIAVEDVERLRTVRERRMEVLLSRPVELERFSALDGVRVLNVRDNGRHIDLAVGGALPPLLQALADCPVVDLTYAPPDLESVFLHYYDVEPEDQPQKADEATEATPCSS